MSSDMSTIVYGGGPGGNLVEGFNAQTGKSIWNDTLPYYSSQSWVFSCITQPTFYVGSPQCTTFNCYSDLTGALLWTTPNVGTYPWNTKYTRRDVNDNNNILY